MQYEQWKTALLPKYYFSYFTLLSQLRAIIFSIPLTHCHFFTSCGYSWNRNQGQSFLPAIPTVSGSRVNSLEDRLSNQERTTAVLLDQAFRIKDGIVSYLQGNKGIQQGERVAHQLLENHIQTITSIVKKLSHDIEVSLLLCLTLLVFAKPLIYSLAMYFSAPGGFI